MSDGQKLKDCIEVFRKTNTELDRRLKEAEAKTQQVRREQTDKLSRQS